MFEQMAPKTKTNPLGAGAPARAGKAAVHRAAVRLTEAEIKAFREAAEAESVALGEWIRRACVAALPARARRALGGGK